jgi:hypothetical protein
MGHALSTVCGICNKQHSRENVQGAIRKLVQAVTLLTSIREEPSSNLIRHTYYPYKFYVDILNPSRQMTEP